MNTWQKLALAALLLAAGRAHAEDTVHYYYTDPQGTVLAKTDATGNVIASYDYAPYGSQALGTPPNGPGYTGHVNDPESGLVYMQARYYDPAVGRFTSADPVAPSAGNGFDFNRYAYANNNPIVNMDPDGRFADSVPRAVNRDIACHHRPECEFGLATAAEQRVKQSSRPAGQCDETCDGYRQTNATILRNQGKALEKASLFAGKFAALNFLGDGVGRLVGKLGRLGRFFGFASEDAGVAFRADATHIFRKAPGHFAEDTAENRALLQGAVKADNFVGARGPNGSISVYRETLSDGRQVWAYVRNGTEITNGGINDVPK